MTGLRLLVLVVFFGLTVAPAAHAQAPPTAGGIEQLLGRFQALLEAGDRAQFASLLEPTPSPDETNRLADTEQFADDVFQSGVRRALVREVDRVALDGAPPGDGHRLIVEVFTETEGQARIATGLIDVRRESDGTDSWRIAGARGLAAVDGLYRLRVNPSAQFAAKNFTISSEDLVLTLGEGTVFQVESEEGVTGLVLLGRGMMRFSPAPETERGQLRIFSGDDVLNAPFETAFIRLSPSDYGDLDLIGAGLAPAPVDPRPLRQAQDLLALEGPKSFNMDLDRYSPELWYLLPTPGDFLAEIQTKRHGTLTYLRAADMPEDVNLFDRSRSLNIAIYPSARRLAARGLSYSEDESSRYDILDYNIETTMFPEREFINGRARLRIRARVRLSAFSLRLAETLAVTQVTSAEYGRPLHLRARNQDTVVVNLPTVVPAGAEFTLEVQYAGRIPSQKVDTEVIQRPGYVPLDAPIVMPEPHFLLSNRSYWYPHNLFPDYATATLRLTLPEGYGGVASGELVTGTDVTPREPQALRGGRVLVFQAREPLRYLAVVVSKLVSVGDESVVLGNGDSVRVAVEANTRQVPRGRELLGVVGGIMRFYADLLGDAPYPSATIALVEDELPGGHSPGYFALVRRQPPYARLSWVNDPASFRDFPDFFVAHELAHQWWGQAIGWRNYHEQWISEGFAQYFAALYAQSTQGDDAFEDMLSKFRRWALAESDQGPISLGYRLGHIKGQGKVFRALVYNKAAAVLHMLRRLLGDEVFFNGVRRFYTEQRFKKTGTEDFQRALEAESGRPLDRFFERWIYGAEVPRVRYARSISDGAVSLRFEQEGELIFDIPVTVTVTYRDGRTEEVVVPLTERVVEHQIATQGAVRRVRINRDNAAVAEFDD